MPRPDAEEPATADRLLADRITGFANPGHAHGHIELNLVLRGQLTLHIAGRFRTLAPGELVAYWAALPHAVVERSPDAELWWLIVPIGRVLAWEGFAPAVRRLLAGEVLAMPADAGLVHRAEDWQAELAGADPETERIVALEVEACLRRMALAAPRRGQGGGPAPRPAVARMVACLAAGYRQDCPLPLVARAAGMTPEASARLFRRTCGVTIHQYLVRLRLSHAHRLLLTTRREVLDIALDAGFGSLSRFYAAFTAAYGTTPGDLRRRAG